MIFAACLVAILILTGVYGLYRAARYIRGGRKLCAVASLLVSVPLLAIGLNSIRAITIVESIFPQRAYRNAQASRCGVPLRKAIRQVDPASGSETAPFSGCPVQTVVNDGQPADALPIDGERCWPSKGPPNLLLNCYGLAFLEFDRSGHLIDTRQKAALVSLLSDWRRTHAGVPVYAIFYVHGWRHDARPGDMDVRRLRVMTSYSAGYMQERCRVAGHQCGALVLGIYVSWPAAIGLVDGENDSLAVLNALTFASRKRVSDQIGAPVLATLAQISTVIWTTSRESRTLLLGHSLGGNLLLSGALERVKVGLVHAAQVFDGKLPGRIEDEKLGLPADLTVLLNPAAEARKWDRLSREAALYFQTKGVACVGRACRIWPLTMPPRLMYAASRCDMFKDLKAAAAMSEAQRDKLGVAVDGTYPCDGVVGRIFEANQRLLEFESGPLERKGIGQLSDSSSDALENAALNRQNALYLEVNWQQKGPKSLTTYANARNYARARCFVEPSWLYCARSRGNAIDESCGARDHATSAWQAWNMGQGGMEKTLGRFAERGAPGQSNVQFGYPSARGRRFGVTTQSSDPLWGVEAHVSAITKHGLIASSPLICGYAKLLFDDAGAIPAGPSTGPDKYMIANGRDYSQMTRIFVK